MYINIFVKNFYKLQKWCKILWKFIYRIYIYICIYKLYLNKKVKWYQSEKLLDGLVYIFIKFTYKTFTYLNSKK